LIGGTFSLATTNVLASRDFTFEEETSELVARTGAYTITSPSTQFTDPADTTTWNALIFKAGSSDLYNFSWNCTNSDPTSSVVIGYQDSGNYISHIVATRSASFSLSFEGDVGYYTENICAQYQIGSQTASVSSACYSRYLEIDSSKRSAKEVGAISNGNQVSVSAVYAIGIAVAGVAVAAVAIVAAVVIVRRKVTQTASAL